MALDKLVDSAQLEEDLAAVADAIREKGGTSDLLSFPSGMIEAIGDIEGGGSSDTPFGDSVKGILRLHYDAINNTGMGTHDPSATTWADLSGNGNHGTVTNGVWGDNYLDFNGTDAWVDCGIQNFEGCTIEVAVRLDTIQSVASGAEADSICGNWQGYGFGLQTKAGKYVGQCKLTNKSSWNEATGSTATAGEFKVLTLVVLQSAGSANSGLSGGGVYLYEDGVRKDYDSVNGSMHRADNNTVTALGSNPNGSAMGINPMDGKIYSVRMYPFGFGATLVAGLAAETAARFNPQS